MPSVYPRRRWRLAFVSAVSAAVLGMVAGCGAPAGVGHAAAGPVAGPRPGLSGGDVLTPSSSTGGEAGLNGRSGW